MIARSLPPNGPSAGRSPPAARRPTPPGAGWSGRRDRPRRSPPPRCRPNAGPARPTDRRARRPEKRRGRSIDRADAAPARARGRPRRGGPAAARLPRDDAPDPSASDVLDRSKRRHGDSNGCGHGLARHAEPEQRPGQQQSAEQRGSRPLDRRVGSKASSRHGSCTTVAPPWSRNRSSLTKYRKPPPR